MIGLLDGAIHMSEEIKDAAFVVPRSIMASMGNNGAFGFGILLAALYATISIDDTLGSEAGDKPPNFLMEYPLYREERNRMWSRIKGFRRTTDLQALLNEKSAAPAISNFWIETRVLEQFTAVDPNATGTYEETQQRDQGTGLKTNMRAHADSARTRSAPSSIQTRDNTYTSLGSGDSEPVDGDTLRDEDEVVDAWVGENSHVGDERGGGGARTRAIICGMRIVMVDTSVQQVALIDT